MIYSIGYEKNIENLAALSLSADPKRKLKNRQDLKAGFVNYLIHNQPHAILNRPLSQNAERIDSLSEKEKLADLFGMDSTLNDMNQKSLIEDLEYPFSSQVDKNFQAALVFLSEQAPKIRSLFDLVFNYYFFAFSSKAAGGSSSGGIGVLWLNPREDWTTQDFAEVIVHELTHQLLFIDERRFRHYRDYDAMASKANFAYSTILNKLRPLDKVIHSYFVGQNVLEFRKKYFGEWSTPHVHPSSTKIQTSLQSTLQSINERHRQLMTQHLVNLVNPLEGVCHESATA